MPPVIDPRRSLLRSACALLLAVALLPPCCRVLGAGLTPNLLDPGQAARGVPISGATPTGFMLDNPAELTFKAPVITFEFGAENILRTRTNGVLTADVTTVGTSETVFIPMGNKHNQTTLALTHGSSSADLFYDHPELGSHINWEMGSSGWALARGIGSVKLGLSGGQFSGHASGTSLLAPEVFGIFTGHTNTKFSTSGSRIQLQARCPVGTRTTLTFTHGVSDSTSKLEFAQTSLVSMTVPIDSEINGIVLDTRISEHTTAHAGAFWSFGHGLDSVTLDSRAMGKLEARTNYSTLEASISKRTSPSILWRVGGFTSARVLDLRATGIRGKNLGIDFKPFNDRIDIDARISLLDTCLYAGTERKLSDSWHLAAYYKRARIRSCLDADYTARGFFGLTATTGNYTYWPFRLNCQGILLSATRTSGAFATTIRLEQVLPLFRLWPRHRNTDHRESVKTLGGTSLMITCSYGM